MFRVSFSNDKSVVLKTYGDNAAGPGREAFAAAQLKHIDLPITRYLLVDDSKNHLPVRFAVTNYLPGIMAGSLKTHPDIESLYRQVGAAVRQIHTVNMPAYGHFDANGIVDPTPSNAQFIRRLIEHSFERFAAMGADPSLSRRLRESVEDHFDRVVPYSAGPVLAHDDIYPNNILVLGSETDRLDLSGIIDFGNAKAADALFDLAKCLFCFEHDAPGSTPHILDGYGAVDHPEPALAFWYYTLLHRVTMWWWLRHVGIIPTADAPSGIIDALSSMIREAR